jgi:hypothetical protein
MNHISELHAGQAQPPGDQPYSSPKLFVYGAMRYLTTGGTGTAQEGSQGQRVRASAGP